MVASSSVRRAPYWHLLETDLHSTQYSAHLASVLDCVSRRMGLSQYAQLFEAYASQIGYSLVEGNYESLRLSPALLGFSSLKTYAEASFGSFAPAYLSTNDQSTELTNHARSLFLNHCQAIHSSPQEGIMSCFGDVVGLSAVAWVDQHMNDEDPSDGLEEFLARMLAGYNVEGSLADQLAQTVDKIITAILRTLGETDFLPEGAIVQDIRAVSPRNLEAVRTFQSLVLYRRLQDFDIHQPNLPLYGTRTIMQALDWAQRCTKVDTFSLTYHVLHQLFVDILETSLVNEQLRLVNALSIWIACHSVHIRDSTLLRVLLSGATSMMTQFDLVTSAQSLLSWSLEIYRGLDDQIQTMPSILLFISSTVRDYCSAEDDEVKARGQALAKWLHSELSALVEIDHHREQVIKKVLPAWSLELPTNLAELNDELTTFDVSEILEDCRITSNKFRLVNKMRDLAHFETSTAGNSFAKADFWRLKKCIPEASQLQVQDIYAFAELLTLHHGHIVSFDGTGLTSEGVRHRHRGQLLEKAPMTVESLTQKPVVSTVRSLLDRPGGGSLRKVYETLQRVLGTLSHHELEFRSWPSELRAELRYLAAFRRPFTKPSSDHLRDLTEKDLFVTSLDDFDTWITAFTDLLCGVIGSTKALFQALGPYVRDDPSFAEDILPVLVHTILFLQVQSPGEEDARSILSDYLATVARSDIACQNTLRAVVDIVLHLRSFVIPGSTSPLSYNEWLRIDFALFSRMAIKCGAFTTALLFLELRPEHNKDQGEATAVEDIYYEIYSHIEEPDGFYSIESKDVQQFLLRRFQHEDEWEKAFQFYGASIEAAPNEPTPEHGMISSLHSYGFNRLAMSTLAARGTSNNTESRHPRLNFDLGWRTETWDLPDIQNDSDMSSTLYSALRAVHRETSREAIDATLQGALRSELERLRLLGTENMADVRQVVQSMLCLRQVAQWQSARHEPGTSVIPWMTRDGLESDRQLEYVCCLPHYVTILMCSQLFSV
jgi:ataxia telangiectasia mutated family protein